MAIAPLALIAPATAANGPTTTVTATAGKGQGSGTWGFVGDVETYNSTTTYSYGIGINPVDGSLVVSDSGKVVYSSLACRFAGAGAAPCQTGTPRVFSYAATGADESTLHEYTVNGQYASDAAPSSSTGRSSGLGGAYAALADRTTYTYGGNPIQHGPRGISFADGKTFVVDSEAVAPVGGPPGPITIFDSALNPTGAMGNTGTWPQRNEPGVHFYPSGTATTPSGNVLVNSQTSDRIQEYKPDGTFVRSILLDLPGTPGGDPGYRDPIGASVDPVDGSMYISLINFRDDPYWKTRPAFLEKRSPDGAVIARIGEGVLPTGQVVMGSAVDPKTQDVFVWTQTSPGFYQFSKDGALIKQFTDKEFPGLTTVRGMTFDKNGRILVTVAEGTRSTRVMILGQTPAPTTTACAAMSADRTSAIITFDCASAATSLQYRQTPVLDYVIEQSTDGGATWSVVPADAASTEKSETVTSLDPAANYQFRVSAWNEAGNGDWGDAALVPTIGVDDEATTVEGTPVTVDVTANDQVIVADATPTSFDLIDPATDAVSSKVTVDGEGTYDVVDGKVRFTPDASFTGKATPVRYRVTYDDCSTEAQLVVTVEPAPVTTTSAPPTTSEPAPSDPSSSAPSTPSTSGPTTPAATSAAAAPSSMAKNGSKPLATTGSPLRFMLVVAGLALAGGIGLAIISMRRRES